MEYKTRAQLINQTSGETDFGTPPEIVEAARWALGGEIDLDPASSPERNWRIKAKRIYTKEDNGLAQPWRGRVWLNHPFHAGEAACKPVCKKKICTRRGYHIAEPIPGNADWIDKLIREYQAERVEAACCITFASTSEGWFRPLYRGWRCWLLPRTNYYLPNGELYRGVTKGSVVTYLGSEPDLFCRAFYTLGAIEAPAVNLLAI